MLLGTVLDHEFKYKIKNNIFACNRLRIVLGNGRFGAHTFVVLIIFYFKKKCVVLEIKLIAASSFNDLMNLVRAVMQSNALQFKLRINYTNEDTI